ARRAIVALVLLVAPVAVPASDDPAGEPLAVEASALVPIDAESSVEVKGLEGQVVISAHEHRELRIVSRGADAEGKEIPVAIWQRGNTLVIGPAPGQTAIARNVRIGVPASFAVSVKGAGSEIAVDGIDGAVDVVAEQSRLRGT